MSHSWEGPNGTRITYTPDLSEVLVHIDGEVEVENVDGAALALRAAAAATEQVGAGDNCTLTIEGSHTVELNGEDLLAFVADYVQRERKGALDEMDTNEVLGLPSAATVGAVKYAHALEHTLRAVHVIAAQEPAETSLPCVLNALKAALLPHQGKPGAAAELKCATCQEALEVTTEGHIEPCERCVAIAYSESCAPNQCDACESAIEVSGTGDIIPCQTCLEAERGSLNVTVALERLGAARAQCDACNDALEVFPPEQGVARIAPCTRCMGQARLAATSEAALRASEATPTAVLSEANATRDPGAPPFPPVREGVPRAKCTRCNGELQVKDDGDIGCIEPCAHCTGNAPEFYATPTVVLSEAPLAHVKKRFKSMGLPTHELRINAAGQLAMPASLWQRHSEEAAKTRLQERGKRSSADDAPVVECANCARPLTLLWDAAPTPQVEMCTHCSAASKPELPSLDCARCGEALVVLRESKGNGKVEPCVSCREAATSLAAELAPRTPSAQDAATAEKPHCASCHSYLDVSAEGAIEPCSVCTVVDVDDFMARCGHCNAELEALLPTDSNAKDVLLVYRCSDCDHGGASEQYKEPMVLFVGDLGPVHERFRAVGMNVSKVGVDRAGRIIMPASLWVLYYNVVARQVADTVLDLSGDTVRLIRPRRTKPDMVRVVKEGDVSGGKGRGGEHRNGGRE